MAPTRRRWSARALLLAAVTALALLALELGFRIWLEARGGSAAHLSERIVALAEEVHRSGDAFSGDTAEASARGDAALSHPYFGWYGSTREDELTDLVRRAGAARDDYEILIVGGSVAGQVSSGGGDDLIEALRSDPRFAGREVRVVTQARGGFKQPQQLNLVSYLIALGWQPDAVINIDGFNEVAIGYQNAVDFEIHPNHPAFFLWGPVAGADVLDRESLDHLLDMRTEQHRARELMAAIERYGLARSAVLSHWLLGRMRKIRERFYAARDAQLEWVAEHGGGKTSVGPPFEAGLEPALELAVRNWAECSRSLQAVCDARSIYYLHVLQPTLHDEGSKPLTRRERIDGKAPDSWVDGARTGYPLLREAGAKLRRDGVNFADATGLFAEQRELRYKDSCHLVGRGCSELAAWIGRAFLENLEGG